MGIRLVDWSSSSQVDNQYWWDNSKWCRIMCHASGSRAKLTRWHSRQEWMGLLKTSSTKLNQMNLIQHISEYTLVLYSKNWRRTDASSWKYYYVHSATICSNYTAKSSTINSIWQIYFSKTIDSCWLNGGIHRSGKLSIYSSTSLKRGRRDTYKDNTAG